MDGDQCNVFVPSNIITRSEIEHLAGAPNFFVNHSNSAPLIGELDDSIIGSFELTRAGVRFDRYHAMLMFSNCTFLPLLEDRGKYSPIAKSSDKDVIAKDASGKVVNVKDTKSTSPNTGLWTSRDIVSYVLSETPINYTGKTTWYDSAYAPYIPYDPTEVKVVIERGKLISGVLDKASIGKGVQGNIFHQVSHEYGNERALELMYNIQHLSINYILQRGYSIGIMDMILPDETLKAIHQIEAGLMRESQLITDRLMRGEIVPPINKTVTEFYEELQLAKLQVIDDFMEPIMRGINHNTNTLFKLIQTGSKGKINNMFHMNSCIGQIILNGERIGQRFSYRRSLVYFPRFDTSPQSRGYIPESYMEGMSVTSLIANAMNARFDFISKALSTSITGEQNRKSIKTLESIVTNNHRMCVKNRMIIQLFYGENGLDARKIMRVKFPTVAISNAALATLHYKAKDATLQAVFDAEFAEIKRHREEYREMAFKLEQSTVSDLITDTRFMPVDVARMLNDTIYANPALVADEAELALMSETVGSFNPARLLYNDNFRGAMPDYTQASTWLLTMLIRSSLTSTRLVSISHKVLVGLLDKIKQIYLNALIDYGVSVGIIAAMSFSAPLTQYMLDAHHRTTSGGTSKGGINKAKEVLSARITAKLEAPSMLLTLDDTFCGKLPAMNPKTIAQTLANRIETMDLRLFTILAQIFFEKFGEPAHPKYVEERNMVSEFTKHNPLLTPPTDLTKWCVRFVLNKTTMILKNMTLETIVARLREAYSQTYIVYTPENVQQIVIRVYIRSAMFNAITVSEIEGVKRGLLNTAIRGVYGVSIANPTELIRSQIDATGAITKATGKWGVKTTGTNLAAAMCVEGIDPYTVQTDAIEETCRVLGIEAARQRIIAEIRAIGVSDVGYAHLTIYADEMTYTGRVTSIERGGLSTRENSNVMLRLGFSAPMQTLEEAGINAMDNKIYGLTANLLVGSTPLSGTNYNSCCVNENFVRDNTVSADSYIDSL